MYLRKMGSVSLLTREGEVEIAKRIEDGERKMLQAVLNSSVAVEELIAIGDRLRHGKIRVKDVVKDIDEDEAEFNEQFYVDRVCKIIDKVRKLQRDTEKLEEKLMEADTEGKKRKVKDLIKANRAQMFEELSDLRLNKPTVDRIVAQLKNFAPIAWQAAQPGGELGVLYLDAHGDLNTPASSPSGRFHGMILRAALGEGAPALMALHPRALAPEQIVMAGVRDLDPAEREFLAASSIQV